MPWIQRNGLLVPDTAAQAVRPPTAMVEVPAVEVPVADERALLESLRDVSVQQLQVLRLIVEALSGRGGRALPVLMTPIDPVQLAYSLLASVRSGEGITFYAKTSGIAPATGSITFRYQTFRDYDPLLVGRARYMTSYHDARITAELRFDGRLVYFHDPVPMVADDVEFEVLRFQYLTMTFPRVIEHIFTNNAEFDAEVTIEAYHIFLRRDVNQRIVRPVLQANLQHLQAVGEGLR